jgi:hypothetical protein
MTLPSFTAEMSVYATSVQYCGHASDAWDGFGVCPAQLLPRRGIGCYRDCVADCSPADPFCADNCHCICYGRPCPRPGCNCWLM